MPARCRLIGSAGAPQGAVRRSAAVGTLTLRQETAPPCRSGVQTAHLLLLSMSMLLAAPAGAADATAPDAAGSASFRLEQPRLPAPPPDLLPGSGDDGESEAVTILKGALIGGLTGGVIGLGIALIENGNWGRDIGIGAGVGIVVGAGVGAIRAFSDVQSFAARDGLGSTDRDPVIQARTLAFTSRF